MDAIVEKDLSQAELSSSGVLKETNSRIQPVQVTFGFETLTGVPVGDSTDHSRELQSGMEAEGKQLCTCSLVEQFNRDWSIRCSQLQNLTPEQYYLVLLEHLQFVQKLTNSQPSVNKIPDSIDGENKNTNSSAPDHEGIQPCPLHGFMSQAEGTSLLNLYFNHEGILPGSSGLVGGIAGILDSLGAQARSSAQEEEELPQGKKLMKLKDRIEKELQNLHEKENYMKKTLRELTASKTKVDKEWAAYISQLHSRLDKQHRQAKEVFYKKHSSCEKKIKERQIEVCSYQTQLTNLLARVETALHHDGCPQPSSGFKTLKKELTTILSMMPEFQVVAKPSYSLHLPKDASKSLPYIVGLVKIISDPKMASSENVNIIITESQIGSVTELKGRMSKTFQDTRSNAPHSENRLSQYDKSTGPPKGIITSLPENENIMPAFSKSFTAVEEESSNELENINTVQNRTITVPLSGGTTVPQNCSSAVSESCSILASQISNITASQSSSANVSQNSDTLTAPHCKGTVGEVEHADLRSLLVTDNSDKSVLTAEPCFTNPDVQASQRPFFVPLTSVFPPVPKLRSVEMRQPSAVPLLNSDQLHSQSFTHQASQKEDDLGPGYQSLEIAGRQTSFCHILQREDMQNYTACYTGGDFQSKMSASLPTTSIYSPVDDSTSLTTPPCSPVLDTGAQSMFSLASSHLDTTSLQDYSPHHTVGNTFVDAFPPAALGSLSGLDVAFRDRVAQVPFSHAHMFPFLRFSECSNFISPTNLEDNIQSSWQSSSTHHDDEVKDIIYDSSSLVMGGADTYGGIQTSPCSGDSSVMTPLDAAGFQHNKSLSYAAAAQKIPISVPPGFQSLPQGGQFHAGSEQKFSETLSASSAISIKCKKSRHRRRGKGRNSCKAESLQMAASTIPTSIRADNTSSFVTFVGSGKVPTSFAPLPNGQVWLAYGFSDQYIELMDEDHMTERITIGGYTTHISCLNEERILLLSQSPEPVLQILDGNHKLTVVRKLKMKVNAVCAGDTGIAVCSSILLLWIPRYRGTEEWVVSKESSCFKEACSCTVMFRDRSEVICVADKEGHAVFFFEKKSRKGAARLTPYTGADFYQGDQEFTPISVSAHSAGFLGILDSTTQSVLILDSKLQLISVISRQDLCCGSPSVIAFSADSSCKLWVASEPGPICLASLPLN
ncbi:uncharacterized protein LOC112553619 isoform X1 [Pomacea canaliculata]|nr:uncharacterized protein LOC112553619 isoform X1 [Pomacea canaliculata]XP_025076749.1 uncharacterized protein LOC112553619 isoform X1 [Pomacea canaliculata]XP_025076750.1 uncharacterized protein LOC112553619 isoform X1 [Pomacea canaliculata]